MLVELQQRPIAESYYPVAAAAVVVVVVVVVVVAAVVVVELVVGPQSVESFILWLYQWLFSFIKVDWITILLFLFLIFFSFAACFNLVFFYHSGKKNLYMVLKV